MSDAIVTSEPAPVKPGWKTTEFWLKLAAILLTALYASGVIPTAGIASQIAAISATLLMALGYTVSRTLVKTAAMLLVLSLALPSSACSNNSRNDTIRATLVSVNAAGSAFALYDANHQQDIAHSAKDRAGAESELAKWRQTQSTVLLVFGSAYRAIALAATANDGLTIEAMSNAAGIVFQELSALGIKLP